MLSREGIFMHFRLLLGAVLSIAFPFIALAQPGPQPPQSPWYIQGSVGGFFRQEASGPTTIFRGPLIAAGTNTSTFDPGLFSGLALGYGMTNHVRLEVEFNYATYTGSTISPFTTNPFFPTITGNRLTRQSGGRYSQYGGTLNAFYDFPISAGLVPYIGGGLGAEYADRTEGHFSGPAVPNFNLLPRSRTIGIGFVEVGISLPATRQISIVPAYRYMHSIGGTGFLQGEASHIVKISARYHF